MTTPLYIKSWQSISALGSKSDEIWDAYLDEQTYLHPNKGHISAPIKSNLESELISIANSDRRFKKLDRSVLMGQWCAQKLKDTTTLNNPMINVGSSRGATDTWEKQYQHFLDKNKCKIDASPSTTLGNISSWIGQIIKSDAPAFSHSITCSSFHHAMLNGAAWLKSGMSAQALIGASEAPLTNFGINQMKGLGIYADSLEEYPVKAFNLNKSGGAMALGEAACLYILELEQNEAGFKISGLGWGTEIIAHGSSISEKGLSLQKSMQMAIHNSGNPDIDIVITHSPGTYKGDLAEHEAIKAVFTELPATTNNKWKIGHSFGASGGMSLELALLMLKNDEFIPLPYIDDQKEPDKIERILINTVGFGGNAVSLIVERV